MRIHYRQSCGRYSTISVPEIVVDAITAVYADPEEPARIIRSHAEHYSKHRPADIPFSHYVSGLIIRQCLRRAALLGPDKLSICKGSSND